MSDGFESRSARLAHRYASTRSAPDLHGDGRLPAPAADRPAVGTPPELDGMGRVMPETGQIGRFMADPRVPLPAPPNSSRGTDSVEPPARLRVSPQPWPRPPASFPQMPCWTCWRRRPSLWARTA